jgi:putative tricarboxylic transport membrane protein
MDRDFAFASAMLALAVPYYLVADAIPTSLLSDTVGPGGLPKTYALILAGLSLILMGQSVVRQRRAAARAAWAAGAVHLERSQLLRTAGMLAIGAFYVLALPYLGYIPTIALLIAGTTYYQGGTMTRQVGVIAVCGALFFWVLFVLVLRIPQPPGLWPELF